MAFSDTVRRELSIEVGGICANPDCQAVVGVYVPRHAKSAGEGAHIVGENPNGPRGISPLTPIERAMAFNGVWLCVGCHTKVDVLYPQNYSITTLQTWKSDAQAWWANVQGTPLQLAAQPNIRLHVSRPSVESLRGARAFWKLHHNLYVQLFALRRQQPVIFERDIPIPHNTEMGISHMSSSPKGGKSWQSDWSTDFFCNDKELLDHMNQLIQSIDVIEPTWPELRDASRRVNFELSDTLAQGITLYLQAFESLGTILKNYESWQPNS